jgi:hypothetical protein
MTVPNEIARPTPPADTAAEHASATLLGRLADELGSRASKTVVYGEPVTAEGVTVIPVAEVGIGFGFGGGAGREAGATRAGEGVGGGGVTAKPRGFIEIKNGAATYKSIRKPWLDVAVPIAAFLAGAAVPLVARRLAKRRLG